MSIHIPVLLKETIDTLKFVKTGVFVDVTLGGGGHSLEIINSFKGRVDKELHLISFDHDSIAISNFKSRLEEFGYISRDGFFELENIRVTVINSNFVNLSDSLKEIGVNEVDCIIADLGISTDQLEDLDRGMSYHSDKDLDLRMDKSLGVKGYDLLNALDKTQLKKIFYEFGDVREAKRLAENIVRQRETKKFRKVKDLLEIIDKSVYSGYSRRLYARVFQALRIAVNSELINLRNFLPQAFDTLSHGGVISIITFHSGEDREVKRFIKSQRDYIDSQYLILPGEQEISTNPKSSSAKLRSITKK